MNTTARSREAPPRVAYLIRTHYATDHTRGLLVACTTAGDILHTCVTLELPWRDNASKVSCIPEGIYPVRSRESDRFGYHYHVQDVPHREWILFHPGNYTHQLLGCILPGRAFAYLDTDRIPDITHSRATLNAMLAAIGPAFTLHVLSAPLPGGALPEAIVTAEKKSGGDSKSPPDSYK